MAQIIIRKGNVQLTIDEIKKAKYLAEGFNVIQIVKGKTKIIESADPTDRHINKLVADNKKLKTENDKLIADNKRLKETKA